MLFLSTVTADRDHSPDNDMHQNVIGKTGGKNPKMIRRDSEIDDDELHIQSIKSNVIEKLNVSKIKNSRSQLQATIILTDMKPKLIVQIDTGAETNVLPLRCFKKLYPQHMNSDEPILNPIITPKPWISLSAYNGGSIKQ